MTERTKSKRGFASMDPARVREIAAKGGKTAHAKGTAHEWTPDEAKVAGRKGGEVASKDVERMRRIGRKGGQSKGANRALGTAVREAAPVATTPVTGEFTTL